MYVLTKAQHDNLWPNLLQQYVACQADKGDAVRFAPAKHAGSFICFSHTSDLVHSD